MSEVTTNEVEVARVALGSIKNKLPVSAISTSMDGFADPESDLQKSHATGATHATALNQKGNIGSTADATACYPMLPLAVDPADAPPVDGTVEEVKPPSVDECPCWRVYLDWCKDGPRNMKPGVYYHGQTTIDGEPARTNEWVCGPLTLEAVTYDRRGESFGRLVRFRDSIGKWHEWNMPMTLLSGSCEDLRAQLLGLGLEIDPRGRAKLPSYLFHSTPKRRVLAALSVGWHDDAFVLPDEVFGDADIYYQSVSASTAEFDQRGSLDDWRGAIASLAPGNMPVMLGLSAGFAGPLMTLAHIENCGLHFVGESSTGKTTAVQAAASVWGPPALVRTWRATSNGLEAAAAESNDTLLVLDEIGESDARVVGEVVYAIGNGRGKARADRKGYSRPIARWRTVLLSSGEKTLEAHMAEAGRKTRAGQSVRLLDIPATGEHGAFDNLHGRDSGRAFADEIKTATARLYGTAGREFVRFLVANHNEDYGAILKQYADRIPTDGGQEARAARQLALVGMAGELATKAGITGWKPGAALEAAIEAFQVWRERRGSGNAERRQILESVRDFVDAHGDSRFSGLNQCESHKVINRAGYTENAGAATDYLFTPGGMREAVQGHDLSRALTVLHAAGWLHTKSAGNHRVQRKVDGKNKGLYCIRLPDDGAAQEAA